MTRSRLLRWCAVAALPFVIGACNDPNVVARAGRHELRVEEYAQLLAEWPSMPLRDDMVERWAHRWVEYALAADRWAAGDSLLDSTMVVAAFAYDVQRYLTDMYLDSLVAARVKIDSATVDSVYLAGEIRIVDHVFRFASAQMTAEQRARQRRRAESIRARLLGGAAWSSVVVESEDRSTLPRGGRIGVVRRTTIDPQLEGAAFALGPGEVSEVVESQHGFHVLRRPPLAEVREEFTEAVRDALFEAADVAIAREVEERWRIEVREEAPELMRRAAFAPLAHIASREVMGTRRGGRFTVADLIRWLRMTPPQLQQDTPNTEDSILVNAVRSFIRRDVMYLEAVQAGVEIPEEIWVDLRFRARQNLDRLRQAMGLDGDDRRTTPMPSIEDAVFDYLRRIARQEQTAYFVPTFVSDELRASARWDVVEAAFPRVIDRARTIRQAADSTVAGSGSP